MPAGVVVFIDIVSTAVPERGIEETLKLAVAPGIADRPSIERFAEPVNPARETVFKTNVACPAAEAVTGVRLLVSNQKSGASGVTAHLAGCETEVPQVEWMSWRVKLCHPEKLVKDPFLGVGTINGVLPPADQVFLSELKVVTKSVQAVPFR